MSKVKVDLQEAKKILNNDKVFLNGENKFNVFDGGKYNSGFTIIIPREWNVDEYNRPESPISYFSCEDITDNMNIDFDGTSTILLGKYKLSKAGKNVFEITKPTEAEDVLVKVNWGGAFNNSRGQDSDYAEEAKAKAFVRSSSNGGGAGYDYWVLPVNYVKDGNPRNVSDILKNIENRENEKYEKIDKELARKKEELENSIKNKERIIDILNPIAEELKNLDSEFEVNYLENGLKYKKYGSFERERKYSDEVVNEFNQILQDERKFATDKEKYMAKYSQMEELLHQYDLQLEFGRAMSLNSNNPYVESKSYRYNEEDYVKFINYIDEKVNVIEEARKDLIIKTKKLEDRMLLDKKKANAKKLGYPTSFTAGNRLYGKTGLCHSFIVDEDGNVRQPMDNVLSNRNHVHQSDWLNSTDGLQIYDQICEGDVIASYSKENSSQPYILDIDWADGKYTQVQLEVLKKLLKEYIENYAEKTKNEDMVDVNNNKINSIGDWLENAIKDKSKICNEERNKMLEKQNKIDQIKEQENEMKKLLEDNKDVDEKLKGAERLDYEVLKEIKKEKGIREW